MRTRVLAVDCDDTLFLRIEPFLAFLNDYYSRSVRSDDLPDRKIAARYGVTEEELLKRETEFLYSQEGLSMKPCPGSQEVLPRIKERFNLHLVVATARQENWRDVTEKLVNANFTANIFSEVIFANRDGNLKGSKDSYLPVAAILIDDHPGRIRGRPNGILYGDYPWQHDCEDLRRAKDWFQVEEILPGLLPP